MIHVSGEKHPTATGGGDSNNDANCAGCPSDNGPECDEGSMSPSGREHEEAAGQSGRQEVLDKSGGRGNRNRHSRLDDGGEGNVERKMYGRWEPSFLEAELRETCLRQLEIPVSPGNVPPDCFPKYAMLPIERCQLWLDVVCCRADARD